MSAGRILVVDATFDFRVADQLVWRGRNATSARALGLEDAKDPVLLPAVATKYAGRDWMLITSDDNMPTEHKALIASLGHLTIATLEGRTHGMDQEHYKHEVLHRWIHKMQDQSGHSIRRYGLRSHAEWTPRKKKLVAKRKR